MATEIVSSVSGKIWDCLFNAASRQLDYLLHYIDSIQKLRKQVKKLADTRARVQGKIQAAYQSGEIIEADVQTWMEEVDNITTEAENFLEDEDKANKRCFKGWCINLKTRYRFNKEAQRKTEAINQHRQEGNFESVSHPASPPDIISSSTGLSFTFESRELIKKQLMEALKEDNVGIIGICGMGGVGKTTLVKEIGKIAKDEKLYDAVVMAVVSKEPRMEKIQEQIATQLGLKLSKIDLAARASLLQRRIKREKQILVILDDIWERIELNNIGIPFREEHEGCKIVLTSRSQGVCNQMDAQRTIIVGTLSTKESWVLFRKVAGQVVDDSDINPIARKVATKCGGLPIAILTLGRALKNQNKYVWTDAARHLKNSSSINIDGMEDNVFSILKLSYDYLRNEEAKELFLYCCFFPEDYLIEKEDLLKYGMDLRWFKEVDTVEDSRVRVHTIVSTLTSCFLLIDENEFIKMHDVIRDFAITIASKDNHVSMVKVGIGLREWPRRDTLSFQDLTGISLMQNHIIKFPDGLECPKLQVLLLQNNHKSLLENPKIPSTFFEGMKDLKVLDLSDLQIHSLPSSLSLLSNLRTLCLSFCTLLVNLSVIGKLTNLEILDLSYLPIKEIPIDFAQLTHLKLFNLTWCQDLMIIPYGVLSCLCNLEELKMKGSFRHWDLEREESRSNARFVELRLLSRLSSLEICIQRGINLPCDMPFRNLKSFDITIGDVRGIGPERNSRSLTLSEEMMTSLQFDWVKDLLKRTDNLPSHLLQRLQNLQEFEIHWCESLVYVIDFEGLDIVNEVAKLLSSLNELTLTNLQEMTHIWKGDTKFLSLCNLKRVDIWSCPKLIVVFPPTQPQSLTCLTNLRISHCRELEEVFGKKEAEAYHQEKEIVVWKRDHTLNSPSLGNLSYVHIHNCNKLKNLFTLSISKSLVQFKILEVSNCSSMQEIIIDEEEVAEEASTERIVFPHLFKLVLRSLQSLTCFCAGLGTIEFPALGFLKIVECPNMKTFGYGEQVTSKLNKVNTKNGTCWLGNLNATVQQLFNEQAMGEKQDEFQQEQGTLSEESSLSK